MPVYEVKDTKPVPAVEGVKPRRRDVKPVMPVGEVRPVDFLRLRSGKNSENEQRPWHDRERAKPAEVEKSAKTIIHLINQHLEMLNLQVHLSLFKDENGYSLDIHDCRDGKVCTKVAEEPIDVDDLPELLERLKQQSGILLDKKF